MQDSTTLQQDTNSYNRYRYVSFFRHDWSGKQNVGAFWGIYWSGVISTGTCGNAVPIVKKLPERVGTML